MATKTDTRAPSASDTHTDIHANPLAPTHNRPSHPHPKKTSRRLIKKQRQRRGEPMDSDARPASSRPASRRSRPGADKRPTGTPMSALLAPLGAVVALTWFIRAMHR